MTHSRLSDMALLAMSTVRSRELQTSSGLLRVLDRFLMNGSARRLDLVLV